VDSFEVQHYEDYRMVLQQF